MKKVRMHKVKSIQNTMETTVTVDPTSKVFNSDWMERLTKINTSNRILM